jgi:hypothetical protein
MNYTYDQIKHTIIALQNDMVLHRRNLKIFPLGSPFGSASDKEYKLMLKWIKKNHPELLI